MSKELAFFYTVKPEQLVPLLRAADRLNMTPKAVMALAFEKGLAELLKREDKVPEAPVPAKTAEPTPAPKKAAAPAQVKRKRGRPRILRAPQVPVPPPVETTTEGPTGPVMSGDYSKCSPGEAENLTKHILRIVLRNPVGHKFSVDQLFTPAAWASMNRSLRLGVSVRVSNAVRFSGADVRSLDNTRLIIVDSRGTGNRTIYKIVKFTAG